MLSSEKQATLGVRRFVQVVNLGHKPCSIWAQGEPGQEGERAHRFLWQKWQAGRKTGRPVAS